MENSLNQRFSDDPASIVPPCREIGTAADLAHWRQLLGTRSLFCLAVARLADVLAEPGMLGPSELAQANAFSHRRRQRQWLAGRVAAKFAAGHLLQRNNDETDTTMSWEPEKWLIVARDDGRPFLQPPAGTTLPQIPDISISHSGELAVAMAASLGRCGIDIQQPSTKVLKVRERFCLPSESTVLAWEHSLAGLDEINRHTLLWAAKEAVIKAVGGRCLEIELTKASGSAEFSGEAAYLFEMSLRQGAPAANPSSCRALVMLLFGYALAMTVIEEV